MRDVPGQAALPDEGGAIDQVGTADSGTGLDVDERVDGGHTLQATPVDGFADGSRARVVFDDRGQTTLLCHSLGDVNPVPPGHAGGADNSRTFGIDRTGHGQREATHAHAGCFLLAADFFHDSCKDGLGPLCDVDEEAGGAPDTAGRVGQSDEAVVGSQLDEGECTGSLRRDESACPASARGDRLVCLGDNPGLDESRYSR